MSKARVVLIQKSQRATIHEWAVEMGNDQGPTIERDSTGPSYHISYN